MKQVQRLKWLPLAFFAVLLLTRAGMPGGFVFDEVHYIPAAKQLVEMKSLLNAEHPPLAKWIMGVGWLVFSQVLGLISEPAVFRVISILFGLWLLWGVRAWMVALGFSERAAQAGVILTGFNFLWFVQSKMATLDIYFVAFAVWGALLIYRGGRSRIGGGRPSLSGRLGGWALLGLGMACKWAAAPFFLIALWIELGLKRRRARSVLPGLCVAGVAYILGFFPLWFLDAGAVLPPDLVDYHFRMLALMNQVGSSRHPYFSSWWEWPTLLRPIWYEFSRVEGSGIRSVWAGGNPLLSWTALPFLVLVGVSAVRRASRTEAASVLAALYWIPLLFWAVAPRGLQMYYYYLPSSLWVGPIVVWAHERYANRLRQRQGWLLTGFVIVCALAFFYFLPIMDGRISTPDRFRIYMWLQSWI